MTAPSLWPELLIQNLRSRVEGCPVTVGLSGGLDSVVLLHLIHSLRNSVSGLQALHVNHHLQPKADEFQRHCERVCDSIDVPLQVIHLDAEELSPEQTGGLETRARAARYRAFEGALQSGGFLLLAHHQDDQQETQLLQLIRGGSVQALAGIPEQRPLGNGVIVRPLLSFPKSQLEVWARELGISWIEDPTNAQNDADRNFLRNEILPSLRARWPQLESGMAASARACREQTALSEATAKALLVRCDVQGDSFELKTLAGVSSTEQINALRYWLMRDGWPLPTGKALAAGLEQLINSPQDRTPAVALNTSGELTLRRHRGRVYRVSAEPRSSHSDELERLVQGGDQLAHGPWSVALVGQGSLGDRALEARFRQGGEVLKEAPGAPTKTLKNWLQEQAIPPWERDRLVLLFCGAQLVAICGLWMSPDYQAELAEKGLRLEISRLSD